MIRAVLDTNTLLSGILWVGPPRNVIRAIAEGQFTLITSEELLAEFTEVIKRAKFAPLLTTSGRTADEVIAQIQRVAHIAAPGNVPPDAVRDPKDLKVLACAVGDKADYIVSGDNDLLILNTYQNIPIVNAVQFLERLARGGE